jgi:hypothetical protein
MVPGAVGEEVPTVNDLSLLLEQSFSAFTLIADETYPESNLTVMVVVPCPLINLVFAGSVHT